MRLDLTPPSNAEDSDDEDSPLDDSEAQEPDLFGDGPDAFRDHRERVVTVSFFFFFFFSKADHVFFSDTDWKDNLCNGCIPCQSHA
jgi:hypothetical protein